MMFNLKQWVTKKMLKRFNGPINHTIRSMSDDELLEGYEVLLDLMARVEQEQLNRIKVTV